MQGMILGAIVKGVQVEGRSFAGHPFDWLNAYSFMTGVALLFGYALLGSTWLVMKTEYNHPTLGTKVRLLCSGLCGRVHGDREHQHAHDECGCERSVVQLPQFLLPVAHTSCDCGPFHHDMV